MSPIVRRASLRLVAVWPVHWPPLGSVAHWDLFTSACDARAALVLALGGKPDGLGCRLPEARPAVQLELFGAAA